MLRTMRAGCLLATLALGGCSGASFYQRTDTEVGSSIVYGPDILHALERIIAVCGDPTLQPGADHFSGEAFFLTRCRSGATHDFTALVDRQPRPERLRNLAFLLGTIDEPLANPVPTGVRGFEVRRQAQLLTWLIPLLTDGLTNGNIPREARDGFLAIVRPLLETAGCDFVATARVDLAPWHFNNIRLTWERLQGAAVLRLHMGFDDAAPEARVRITSSINCLGSTRNLANSTLKMFLPDGSHDVNLAGADLTIDYQIDIAQPAAGQTTNSLAVTLRDVAFHVARVDVVPFGNAVGDGLLTNALAEANVTPASIASQVEDTLGDALAPLGDRLAQLIEDSLDLEATPDRAAREVIGREVEPSSTPRQNQIRFEARRTDKICFVLPNVGPVCVDPIKPGKPDRPCLRVPTIGGGSCIPQP